MAIIETRELHKTYHNGQVDTPVLHGVDLTVEGGEFVAIMGPSGCGKSTLLYVLGLMSAFDSGSVRIDGREISSLSDAEKTHLRGRTMAFVFQRFNLLPALTAEDNVAMSLTLRRENDAGRSAEMLHRVGLGDKLRRRPGALSMGEQQRVAIARGLVGRPAILFADEPTGNLDSDSSAAVLGLLSEFNRETGQTILMVTHDADAARWAHRTIHMRDGQFIDE